MLKTATIVGGGHHSRTFLNWLQVCFIRPLFKTSFTNSCCSSCFHFHPWPLILQYIPRQHFSKQDAIVKEKTTSRLNEEQLSSRKFNNRSSRTSFRLNQLVHGPGPPKRTFRYHSCGVMLTHIFGKVNYSTFILCLIAMLNVQLNRI